MYADQNWGLRGRADSPAHGYLSLAQCTHALLGSLGPTRHASLRQAVPSQSHRECRGDPSTEQTGDSRVYLASHEASPQLGDVGVCFR